MGSVYIAASAVECSYVVCLVSCPTLPAPRLKQEFYCDVGLHLYDAAVVEYYFICRMSSSLSRV